MHAISSLGRGGEERSELPDEDGWEKKGEKDESEMLKGRRVPCRIEFSNKTTATSFLETILSFEETEKGTGKEKIDSRDE